MELNDLLAQIDSLKIEIDKLRPLKAEVEHRIMQKFRLDWNYHSNAIEGNSLTLGETRAFLLEGLTASGKPLKDYLDIKGHNELIDFLQLFIQREEQLTEAAIREMHKILLREPYETEAVTLDGKIVKKLVKLGDYKTTANFVRTGSREIHQYALPEDVSPRMKEFIDWHRDCEKKSDLHPVIHAAIFHHKFLAIHPFDDGNGRLGRILMNLILMRHGFPPVVIKLAARDPYVAALRRADVGETAGIVSFIGENLVDAEKLYLRGAGGESIEDADDVDKAVALLKQELRAAPKPIDLSLEIQRVHFDEKLIPLLQRLDSKLHQFDELFAKSWGELNHNRRKVGGGAFGGQIFRAPRQNVPGQLREFTRVGEILIYGSFAFHWEGFLKDGPNDFSVNLAFDIRYDERKMQFSCSEPRINRQMLYSEWFSEDELKKFITDFTKAVLNKIEQQLSRNRSKQ